ncbi:zinc-binding dehydrogenase [Nocardia yamanashiensis]|uniref:quinone oxidoreductase family protein n=1 Tax=Nocardia yamanashiensis TaxID=209247 RepID=UPI001E358A92|nr:zinc-binding dehydrogenase [Nocardia yamanashiensis]UGT43053.1 zinc-binding dehydrogenase [Nocardia yamanashiensis]
MRAILLTATGGPDVLVPGEVPAPRPGAGEVLVRSEAIPVLYPETMLRSGAFPIPLDKPFVFGTQAVGIVAEIGAGVDSAWIGQRVMLGSNAFGTYAELVCVPVDGIVAVPQALSPEDAAAVSMSGSVALPLLERAALTGTETVLVEAGATGIGGYLVQLAKEFGAARVIATAGGQEKGDRARELGADEVIDHRAADWPQRLAEVLAGTTVDVVFDSIGGESASALLDLVTPLRGRMLSYGWLSGAPAQISAMDVIGRGLTLVGCAGPAWLAGVAAARAAVLERAATGGLTVLSDLRLPLEQAAEAHRRLDERAALGTIVLRP